MDIEAIIRQYLPQVIHMSLATSRDNRPWVCEVHFAYDDQLNLYFFTDPKARHSQEIAANPHVAGNIVTQHHLNQKVRGVYFEGMAKELEGVDENHPAYQLYRDRLNAGSWLLAGLKAPDGGRMYQVAVADFYVFDNYAGPNTKHHLPWDQTKGAAK